MVVAVKGSCLSVRLTVVCCGSAAGKIEGDVRVSGYPKVQETFARIMGYVEQSDIHSPNVCPATSLSPVHAAALAASVLKPSAS